MIEEARKKIEECIKDTIKILESIDSPEVLETMKEYYQFCIKKINIRIEEVKK